VLHRELLLFGASAFGALFGTVAADRLGIELALAGAVPGAALGAGLLHGLYRMPRPALTLLGIGYLGAWYATVYGAGYAKSTLDAAARARLAWWAGDLTHARWLSSGALAVIVVVLIAAASLPALSARAERRLALELTLLGLAVGAAGPIAFAGGFGAVLAERAARAHTARTRLALAALASAGGLALADAVQRALLGGYALALGSITGFAALPFVYVACVRAKQRVGSPKRRWLLALESLLVLATSALGYYALYRVVLVIHGAA
jgi:hypothetical protein